MRHTSFPSPLALAGLAASFALMAAAAAQPASPRDGEDHPPPPEAFQACKSLGMGAACEVSTPRGTVKGDCWAPEANKPLACRPTNPPPRSGEQAPGKKPKGQQ